MSQTNINKEIPVATIPVAENTNNTNKWFIKSKIETLFVKIERVLLIAILGTITFAIILWIFGSILYGYYKTIDCLFIQDSYNSCPRLFSSFKTSNNQIDWQYSMNSTTNAKYSLSCYQTTYVTAVENAAGDWLDLFGVDTHLTATCLTIVDGRNKWKTHLKLVKNNDKFTEDKFQEITCGENQFDIKLSDTKYIFSIENKFT